MMTGRAAVAAPERGMGVEGLDFRLSPRVRRGASAGSYEPEPDDPLYRPLRVYALDPSASALDGAVATVDVPYEPLEPGPAGRLLRIADDGLLSERPAPPLDLEDRRILIRQGRPPSTTDPGFRAQMAYAVCSTTFATFRRALGREPTWGFDRASGADANRLIVRSCVDGSRNAYYDPNRGELRLGAFEADAVVEGRNVAGGRVATALIHDIVVHEMSHALLDGLRARFTHPSNPDVLAFHEAFADLVAIFQRFTYRDVVRAAIDEARGVVTQAALLTEIGKQFAQNAGYGSALRMAVIDPGSLRDDAEEPHERGQRLVAAVFRAFTTVYARKASRLTRLASNDSGTLPPGRIPSLLAEQLAELAARLAAQFLAICIRAIDYCPPVDITFGEYLRAVITADMDLVADDPWAYREAWIDGFGAFGIRPRGVPSLTLDALRWHGAGDDLPPIPRLAFRELRFDGDPGRPADERELLEQARALGELAGDPRHRPAFGLASGGDPDLEGDDLDLPTVESVRSLRRIGPDGQLRFDLVADVTQRRVVRPREGAPGFDFFGGSTVLIDPRGRIRYLVTKSVLHRERLAAQREFLKRNLESQESRFFEVSVGNLALPRPQGFRIVHDVSRKSTS